MRIFEIFCITILLSACSGGVGFGELSPSGSSGDDDDDTEGQTADIPEEVSGSFLTCDFESDFNDSSPFQTIGCTIRDENGESYPEDYKYELAIKVESIVTPIATTPSNNPKWDFKADLPTSVLKQSGATLVIKLDNDIDAPVEYSLPIDEIVEPLGSTPADYTIQKLTQFSTNTSWTPSSLIEDKIADQDFKIHKTEFCDHNGVRSAFDPAKEFSDFLATLFDSDQEAIPVPLIDNKQTLFTENDVVNLCFEEFSFSGTEKAFVHEINFGSRVSCYAFKIGKTYYFINPRGGDDELREVINLESLTQFVDKVSKCE